MGQRQAGVVQEGAAVGGAELSEIKRYSKEDQPRAWRTAPPCTRCKHPAVYHGRALPHCDACDCTGYTR
jgi:hypothetical protein